MKKMLLRKKPYKISQNGNDGIKVVLNQLCGLLPGDLVYQVKRSDGVIELIPEKNTKNP